MKVAPGIEPDQERTSYENKAHEQNRAPHSNGVRRRAHHVCSDRSPSRKGRRRGGSRRENDSGDKSGSIRRQSDDVLHEMQRLDGYLFRRRQGGRKSDPRPQRTSLPSLQNNYPNGWRREKCHRQSDSHLHERERRHDSLLHPEQVKIVCHTTRWLGFCSSSATDCF